MTTGNSKIESLEDARAMVRHYKKLGTNVIKQDMQPQRRQWVIQAAREEGVNVTNEGGGDFRLDLTKALDGTPLIPSARRDWLPGSMPFEPGRVRR